MQYRLLNKLFITMPSRTPIIEEVSIINKSCILTLFVITFKLYPSAYKRLYSSQKLLISDLLRLITVINITIENIPTTNRPRRVNTEVTLDIKSFAPNRSDMSVIFSAIKSSFI